MCVAVTGYGLDGPAAEWPAFDYVIQAGVGIAAMTGEPDGPPTLSGYSVVDNSTGIMAALGLVSMVLEGKGGQVDVSLFDVMLSQLNYKAATYLNGGGPPGRQAMGAHSFYVPAQLFETADGYLALFVTHDEFWRRVCVELGRPEWSDDPRFATMHARAEHRDDAPRGARLGAEVGVGGGVDGAAASARFPVGPVADLDAVLDGELVRRARDGGVGRHRRRSPAHGRQSDPCRGASGRGPRTAAAARAHRRGAHSVVVDDDLAAGGNRLAGEDPAVVDLLGRERVVHPHGRGAVVEVGHAGGAAPRLARERRLEPAAPRGVEDRVAELVVDGLLATAEPDHQRLGGRRLGEGREIAEITKRSMNTWRRATPSCSMPASTTSM